MCVGGGGVLNTFEVISNKYSKRKAMLIIAFLLLYLLLMIPDFHLYVFSVCVCWGGGFLIHLKS